MRHMDVIREQLDFDRNDRLEREAWQKARAERTITPPRPQEYSSDGHDGKCSCHEAIICPDE